MKHIANSADPIRIFKPQNYPGAFIFFKFFSKIVKCSLTQLKYIQNQNICKAVDGKPFSDWVIWTFRPSLVVHTVHVTMLRARNKKHICLTSHILQTTYFLMSFMAEVWVFPSPYIKKFCFLIEGEFSFSQPYFQSLKPDKNILSQISKH